MVSSRENLVKGESISKLPMKLLESCSKVSAANIKRSLTLCLLAVNDSKIATNCFESSYVGVCKQIKLV